MDTDRVYQSGLIYRNDIVGWLTSCFVQGGDSHTLFSIAVMAGIDREFCKEIKRLENMKFLTLQENKK